MWIKVKGSEYFQCVSICMPGRLSACLLFPGLRRPQLLACWQLYGKAWRSEQNTPVGRARGSTLSLLTKPLYSCYLGQQRELEDVQSDRIVMAIQQLVSLQTLVRIQAVSQRSKGTASQCQRSHYRPWFESRLYHRGLKALHLSARGGSTDHLAEHGSIAEV